MVANQRTIWTWPNCCNKVSLVVKAFHVSNNFRLKHDKIVMITIAKILCDMYLYVYDENELCNVIVNL